MDSERLRKSNKLRAIRVSSPRQASRDPKDSKDLQVISTIEVLEAHRRLLKGVLAVEERIKSSSLKY